MKTNTFNKVTGTKETAAKSAPTRTKKPLNALAAVGEAAYRSSSQMKMRNRWTSRAATEVMR